MEIHRFQAAHCELCGGIVGAHEALGRDEPAEVEEGNREERACEISELGRPACGARRKYELMLLKSQHKG